MSQTIDISPALKKNLQSFRMKRRDGIAAYIGELSSWSLIIYNAHKSFYTAKVNKKQLVLEEDDILEDITVEDLAEELPESSPRYVVLAHKLTHSDGRMSFPLVLINWIPSGAQTALMTLHASAYILFANMTDANKTIEIRDGADSLTTEVIDKLCDQ